MTPLVHTDSCFVFVVGNWFRFRKDGKALAKLTFFGSQGRNNIYE
jgi:hypothetical protein